MSNDITATCCEDVLTHQSTKFWVKNEEKAFTANTVKPPLSAQIKISIARYLSPALVLDNTSRMLYN